MTNETVILPGGGKTKQETKLAWYNALKTFFEERGFEIATGSAFGVVGTEFYFGIRCDEHKGFLIYSTPWNDIYTRMAIGFYTTSDDGETITITQMAGGDYTQTLDVNGGALSMEITHYRDDDNAYVSAKFWTAYGAAIMCGYSDCIGGVKRCMLAYNTSSTGLGTYSNIVLDINRRYTHNTTESSSYIYYLEASVSKTFDQSMFKAYTCPVLLMYKQGAYSGPWILQGMLKGVTCIKGNFSCSYGQIVTLDGIDYFYAGLGVFLPLL